MTPTISLITATRRPDKYFELIQEVDSKMGSLIKEFNALVHESQSDEYKKIKEKNSKIRILKVSDNYIYKNGWDSVYNLLGKFSTSNFLLMLFDTDKIENLNLEEFKKYLNSGYDLFGFNVFMQRASGVYEKKYQLYRNNFGFEWRGAVHENLINTKSANGILHSNLLHKQFEIPIEHFSILHQNALDIYSTQTKRNKDGFVILEKLEEGSDSFERNLLYETLTWKIVNENMFHYNKLWFEHHYKVNKDAVDYYYNIAKKKYDL
jgi:hypothetical protein